MAREAELPDGTILEFPDGTPDEVIDRAVRAHLSSGRTPKSADDPSLWAGGRVPSTNPTDGASFGENLAAGAGSAVADLWAGIKQSGVAGAQYLAEGGPYGAAARRLMPGAFEERNVAGLVSGQPQRRGADIGGRISDALEPTARAMRAEYGERAALDAPLMETGGGKVGYGATTLASLLYAPAMATRGTAAAPLVLPRTLVGNVGQGAVLGAVTQPLAEGDSRLANAGIGAGAGALGQGVAVGLRKWGQSAADAVTPEAREVFEAAKARGISLTPAQLSDSRFLKWMQSMLRSVPFTGAQARHEQQVGAINRAVASAIGEDAPQVTSAVYAAAKARQSAKFNELTARNDLRVDNALMQNLSRIADEARMAGDDVYGRVTAAIDRLARDAVAGPRGVTVPGRAYQSLDSELGRATKAGDEGAHYLGRVRDAVRSAMDNSISPEDSAAWAALRREYGNRKTLTPLVAAANDGPLSPARLQSAVTNSRWAKEAMASGTRGELGTLAKIGQRIKEPPSSGTAERMMFGGAFNPVNWPGLAAGVTVGAPVSRALDSKGLAALMMRENPGMKRKAAARTAGALAKLMGLQALPVAADEG